MAEIAVDGAEVARLGATLAEVGAFLATVDRVSRDEPWAFGPGRTGGAASEVLGNWERHRLLLARELAALSDGVRFHPTPTRQCEHGGAHIPNDPSHTERRLGEHDLRA